MPAERAPSSRSTKNAQSPLSAADLVAEVSPEAMARSLAGAYYEIIQLPQEKASFRSLSPFIEWYDRLISQLAQGEVPGIAISGDGDSDFHAEDVSALREAISSLSPEKRLAILKIMLRLSDLLTKQSLALQRQRPSALVSETLQRVKAAQAQIRQSLDLVTDAKLQVVRKAIEQSSQKIKEAAEATSEIIEPFTKPISNVALGIGVVVGFLGLLWLSR